eukprot:jgi/Chlat1/9064/Chrsp94S08362
MANGDAHIPAVRQAQDPRYDYDLFVIGGGSGGVRAARTSAAYGAKVAVVELPYSPVSSDSKGGVGGTCVIRGCVPKKLLIYGSEFKQHFEDANGYGWQNSKNPLHDWDVLLRGKTTEIDRLNGVYKRMLASAGVTLMEGRARLVDNHTVEVTSLPPEDVGDSTTENYTAKYILIASGARAVKLNIPGGEHTITSDEALSLEKLPKSIAIVGGGYIAVEFSHIFNGLGVDVHLIHRAPMPLRGFDKECTEVIKTNLEKRGVHLVKNDNGSFTVETDKAGAITVDLVFFATGRDPNTKGLGVEDIGIKLSKKNAIVVNEYSQTTVENIYAIGDVTDRLALTPVALMEGSALSKTLFGGKPTPVNYTNIASAVFAQPPLGKVGLSEEEAVEQATGDIDVFTSKFRPMKYTVSGRDEQSFMKIIVEKETDKVLGVWMVGPDSAEIMQGIAIAIKAGATKADFDSTVGIHPTAAEEFVSMRTATRTIPHKSKM